MLLHYFSPIHHSCTKVWTLLCSSHLEKSFISVKHLNAEINVNAQCVYMTTSSGYCWIVVWLIFTVQLCEIDMYRCGQTAEGYEGVTVIHYGMECINLYFLYIHRKYIYILFTKHVIRTSSGIMMSSMRYDEEWYCHNLLHKYQTDNNPPKLWAPSSFGVIWWNALGWSPYRLMVAGHIRRLCCSQQSAVSWGKISAKKETYLIAFLA